MSNSSSNERLARSEPYLGKDRDQLREIILDRDEEIERLSVENTELRRCLDGGVDCAEEKLRLRAALKGLPVETSRDDARDAARYRFIRQSEATLSPEQEYPYAALWAQIYLKGNEESKMDALVDAAMAGELNAEEPSVPTGEDHFLQCTGCKALQGTPLLSNGTISLLPFDGWTFSTTRGWRCPNCDEPSPVNGEAPQ